MISVEEVWQASLPAGTECLAAAGELRRPVEGVLTLRPRPPGLDAPRGGELVLISGQAVTALGLTLEAILRSLPGSAAAAAVRGEVSQSAVALAEELRIPLLRLPGAGPLVGLAREIQHLLAERRSAWYQRQHQVLQDLTALALQGGGLPALATRLSELTGGAVGYVDGTGHILACALPPDLNETRSAARRDALTASEPAPDDSRFSLPVLVAEQQAAELVLVSPIGVPEAEIRAVLAAGATAGAIELAREHAVQETVYRVQGDLVAELVNSDVIPAELGRRAERLGYDLAASRIAITFGPAFDGPGALPTMRRRLGRVLDGYGVAAPLHAAGGTVTAFCTVPAEAPAGHGRRLADRLRRDLAAGDGRPAVQAGVSRPYSGAAGFRLALQEAQQALELGQSLFPDRPVIHFDDLGIYRVLFALRDNELLRAFHDDLLGRLTAYDAAKGTHLIPTLRAYLHAGNTAEVARKMHLHRNTLLYRLRRIREITGLDPDDAETRLALHLALKMADILRAGAHEAS